MGEFFFFYPKRLIAGALARRGFVATRGSKPVKTAIRVDELDAARNMLVVVTKTDESGSFYIPCSDAHDGFFYASTAPLQPSRRRRSLYLELCRGQLARIQRKRADWSFSGFSTPLALRQQLMRAIQKFSILATTDDDIPEYDDDTTALFAELCEIGQKINELYLSQTLVARRKVSTWVTRFGLAADPREDWTTPFDSIFFNSKSGRSRSKLAPFFKTIVLRVNWRDVERNGVYDWSRLDAAIRDARARGMRVTLGPLVRWGSDLPDRLQRPTIDSEVLRGEYERYLSSALDAVGRRVNRWIVATNVEASPTLATFEFRLACATSTCYAIRSRFPRAQAFLGFEQAFGDEARFADPPLVYPVDLATRLAARQAFDGFYLEANFGLTPHTTAPRDPMELHRFFDRWTASGARLAVAISCPSASPCVSSPNVDPSELLTSALGEKPKRSFFFHSNCCGKPLEELLWNAQIQQELARRFYSTALARKSVDELIWSRWLDAPLMSYDDYAAATSVFDAPAPDDAPSENQKRLDAIDDVYDEIASCDDEEFSEEEDELLDEIDLCSDDASRSRSESVSFSADVEAPENFTPTSGLVGPDRRPKATLFKLAALRHAYLEED